MKKIAAVLCMAIAVTLSGCGLGSTRTSAVSEKAESASNKNSSMEAAIIENDKRVKDMVAKMSPDEKISQMIIPAIRTWDGENVTDLDEFPELKEALRAHQYGGVILFGSNIDGTEKTAKLVYGLQANNSENADVSVNIPYFMSVDEEGGSVIRITSGTRMTGNMAIGATGGNAEKNAEITGEIIGEELSALGFNADFAPVIDVNSNPANPVIGTHHFPTTLRLLPLWVRLMPKD